MKIKILTDNQLALIENPDLYWIDGDNAVTALEHLEYMQSVGVTVPQALIDYVNSPEAATVIEKPKTTSPAFDPASGLFYYYDESLDLNLSVQMFSDGQGTNSSNVVPGSYLRRFNGSFMTNTRALGRPYPIVMFEFCCTVDSSTPDAYIDALHYDMDGGDETLVGRLPFNQNNGQMAAYWLNAKILIPANRRFTGRIGGASVSYPQSYMSFRRVVEL